MGDGQLVDHKPAVSKPAPRRSHVRNTGITERRRGGTVSVQRGLLSKEDRYEGSGKVVP